MPLDLEPCKNVESYFVDSSDDNPEWKRKCIWVDSCPKADECNRKSFTTAGCWSFSHPHFAMSYVMQHLMMSGKHQMSKEVAIETIQAGLVWGWSTDGFREREGYRAQVASIKANKESGSSSKANSKKILAKPVKNFCDKSGSRFFT